MAVLHSVLGRDVVRDLRDKSRNEHSRARSADARECSLRIRYAACPGRPLARKQGLGKAVTAPKEHRIDRLRNAYAMEKQTDSMLESQASRLEHYPSLKGRIEQHID
ncbi:DUF892 family protein [Trinickia sp. NRRL B-1857]|uniref:DUF892 family protein n=1 Tax=Trinickia sp. NRRL B-1857 TaxID=3162879 RepID=UPI003D2D9437